MDVTRILRTENERKVPTASLVLAFAIHDSRHHTFMSDINACKLDHCFQCQGLWACERVHGYQDKAGDVRNVSREGCFPNVPLVVATILLVSSTSPGESYFTCHVERQNI